MSAAELYTLHTLREGEIIHFLFIVAVSVENPQFAAFFLNFVLNFVLTTLILS